MRCCARPTSRGARRSSERVQRPVCVGHARSGDRVGGWRSPVNAMGVPMTRSRPLVAAGGRVPGLYPQLRGRRRRRGRRHRGDPEPPRLPARARRRRAVDHPLVPLADGRRRLRRGRLHAASTRCSGRSTRPSRSSRRRTGTGCGCCSTSCRTTPRAPTRGSPRPWPRRPGRRPAPGSCSATAVGRTAPSRPRLDRRVRRPGVERVAEADGRPGQWYLHQFAIEQPDLDWAQPRRPRRCSRTCCGRGSRGAWTASGSTSPTRWSRTSRPWTAGRRRGLARRLGAGRDDPAHGPGGRARGLPRRGGAIADA